MLKEEVMGPVAQSLALYSHFLTLRARIFEKGIQKQSKDWTSVENGNSWTRVEKVEGRVYTEISKHGDWIGCTVADFKSGRDYGVGASFCFTLSPDEQNWQSAAYDAISGTKYRSESYNGLPAAAKKVFDLEDIMTGKK